MIFISQQFEISFNPSNNLLRGRQVLSIQTGEGSCLEPRAFSTETGVVAGGRGLKFLHQRAKAPIGKNSNSVTSFTKHKLS